MIQNGQKNRIATDTKNTYKATLSCREAAAAKNVAKINRSLGDSSRLFYAKLRRYYPADFTAYLREDNRMHLDHDNHVILSCVKPITETRNGKCSL